MLFTIQFASPEILTVIAVTIEQFEMKEHIIFHFLKQRLFTLILQQISQCFVLKNIKCYLSSKISPKSLKNNDFFKTKMTALKKCPLCLKSPSSSFYHIIYKHSYMKASFDFLIDYRKKLRTITAIKKVEIVLFHCLEEKKIS